MFQPEERKEKSLQEPRGDEEIQFSWGLRKGSITLYESFTLDGTKYSLYDCVYLWRIGQDEPDIGKLVRIWETENQEKKVEVVWFFRATEIAQWLGDIKPHRREIFLACGHGKGLSNLEPLEAISGKCNVVCSSKHERNPRPSEEELRMADYIFSRTFHVKKYKISKKFPSSINGVEVGHFFNRADIKPTVCAEPKGNSIARSKETPVKDQSTGEERGTVCAEPKGNSKATTEQTPVKATKKDQSAREEKGADRLSVPATSSCRQVKISMKDGSHAGVGVKRSVHFLSASPSDVSPLKKQKLLSSIAGGPGDDAQTCPQSTISGQEKYMIYKDSRGEKDVSTRVSLDDKSRLSADGGAGNKQHITPTIHNKYMEVPRSAGKGSREENKDVSTRVSLDNKSIISADRGAGNKQHITQTTHNKYMQVTRRPDMDTSKWLKLEVWEEERLHEANEKGTLVLLENLDPTFTNAEVEDIVWHVFSQNIKAKMVQPTAFSNPRNGQAFAIFKTKEAADDVVSKLINGCLILGDGRPIVGRRRPLRKFGPSGGFAGHLTLDRTKPHRQREEMRNAVATSHFTQSNTIEFEMAMQWRVLEEKSNMWWAALHEEQDNKIEALTKQMKLQ